MMSGPAIEVDELEKRYGDHRAVAGVTFRVEAGEVFSLLGPNGAGKTTTVEILETLRRATAGTTRVLGLDVEADPGSVRERIGVLPQDFRAYETLTCRENLAYFAAMFQVDPDLDALLDLVGLQERAGDRYGTLSGGLQQRLGIAIALVNDPQLVFLDEPTTGLDPHARRQVWKVIEGLREKGTTVLLTTHYMEEAQHLSDRVAILHRGRLIALDTPQALIEAHSGGQELVVRGPARLEGELGPGVRRRNGAFLVQPEPGELGALVTRLAEDPEVQALELTHPTLEDVFLSLTGHALDEGGEAPSVA